MQRKREDEKKKKKKQNKKQKKKKKRRMKKNPRVISTLPPIGASLPSRIFALGTLTLALLWVLLLSVLPKGREKMKKHKRKREAHKKETTQQTLLF